MKSYFRVLYLYVISAITLAMIVGGVIATFNAVAEYKYPHSYYSSYYDDEDDYDYEEIQEKKYKEDVRNAKMIFTDIAVVLIATPLYVYHWGRIEKERMEMEV